MAFHSLFSQRASSLPARVSKYKVLFPPISCTLGLPVRFQNSHLSFTLNDPGNFSRDTPRGNLSSDQPHSKHSGAVCSLTGPESDRACCALQSGRLLSLQPSNTTRLPVTIYSLSTVSGAFDILVGNHPSPYSLALPLTHDFLRSHSCHPSW